MAPVPLPTLHLYVSDGCTSCERTRNALAGCSRVRALVTVVEHTLGEPQGDRPAGVIAGPTMIFAGTVVGLGTPDCKELADRIEAMLRESTREGSR